MELKAKHVLVTGAAKRLGRAFTDAFLAQGARVTAHTFQTPFAPLTDRVQTFSADLREVSQIRSLVDEATQTFGPVAILIASASDFFPTPTETCSEQDWDRLLDLNLKAPFFLAQACAPGLKEQKGCVLNLCDIHVSHPLKRFAPYSASKGGLWTLTRVLAAEWAPHVRVNSISPGPVLLPGGFTEEQKERAAQSTLLGRIGTANDIVEAARFLIGNEYITGVDLKVDGGASLV